METVDSRCVRDRKLKKLRTMAAIQGEILKCVFSGDLGGFMELSGDQEGAEERTDLCGVTDEVGRNALLTAAMLGRSAMVQELVVKHGGLVDEKTVRGYSSLHLAACWGHVDTVRTLVDLGADLQGHTFRGDRAVDLARKYSRTDCVDCLILAETKQDLVSYVASIKDLISDPKMKLTKEEKNICTQTCSAASSWIHGVKNPTVSDVTAQRTNMEEALQPILSKLSAQRENITDISAGKSE